MEEVHRWHFHDMTSWYGFTLGIHRSLKYSASLLSSLVTFLTQKISFLDITIYIQESQLHTRLYTKTTDRHMYLNYFSEHPMSLKKSIPCSQFLRLKEYTLNLNICWRIKYIYICFHLEGTAPWHHTKSLDEKWRVHKGTTVDIRKQWRHGYTTYVHHNIQ